MVDATESPELYDFRLGSGVVRDEEGVEVFRGSIEGEREDALTEVVGSDCWVGVLGMGGAPCIMDIRFILLASVGLTVLAPSPVAWDAEGGIPGITDKRLADDDGVEVPRPVGRPGDRTANDADRVCSGVMVGVERSACPCLEGGCIDFALAALAVARRAPSVAAFPVGPRLALPEKPASERLLVEMLDAKLGRLLCAGLVAISPSVTPGPIDLRAGLVPFVPETGGY